MTATQDPGMFEVSVIMICRDGQAYLAEAVESVLAQTVPGWELLIVDDGSRDGSLGIAGEYAKAEGARVRLLSSPAGRSVGMSAARNSGLRHASAEYVALLDCDDTWLPDRLEVQLALARLYPDADVICGPTLYWRSWAGGTDTIRPLGVPPGMKEPPSLLAAMLRNELNAPATCSVLMRRTTALKLNGFEETFPSMFEDRAFFTKVYLRARVLVTDRYLDRYRQHDQSASSVAQQRGDYHPRRASRAHYRFLKWVEEYLHWQHVSDPEIWSAWRTGMWPYLHPLRYRVMSRADACGAGDALRRLRDVALRRTGASS
jgi:glycosyltransferase involved in cell wall biosynthesis